MPCLRAPARSIAHVPLRRVVRAAVALVCLVLAAAGQAQVASLRTYGAAEGLRVLGAECLVDDAQGNLWACTYAGLYRYEGERFERVGVGAGLDDAYVMNLSPTRRGDGLWVGTAGNLYFWDGQAATRVTDPQGSPIPSAIGHMVAALDDGAVALSKGHAWRVRAVGGRWRTTSLFTEAQVQAHPQLAEVEAVYRDGDALWLGCARALCRLDADGTVRVYGPGDGVPEDAWTDLLRDRSGTLWARGPMHVVSLASGAEHFAAHPVPAPAMMSGITRHLDLTQDRSGRVLTRSDAGIVRWNGTAWDVLDVREGLPDAPPNAMWVSHDGTLWLAYGGLGIVRWRGYGDLQNWTESEGLRGLPNWALARDAQGGMLFGNERGLYRLAPGARHITPVATPLKERIHDVFGLALGPDGATWVALYGGDLMRLVDGQARVVATLPHHLRHMLFDRRGRLWLCTTEGVYLIDDLAHPQPRRFEGLPAISFGDVVEDARGRLWFAGKGGLLRLDGQVVTPIKVSGELPNQLYDKLSIGTDGMLWVAVDDAGLFHGAMNDDATLALRAVDDPLLRDSLPYFMRHDRQGRLWVAGSGGLDVLDQGQWTRLSESDGLVSQDLSEGAFFQDRDGSVWVGSARGVSHLEHPGRLLEPRPVTLRVARVERGGTRVQPGATLPWGQLPVRVSLSTPGSLAGPDVLRFRYRLRGRQDAWIETGSRTLDFPALGDGLQVIEVQAIDLARRAESPVVSFSFRLRPPWWRSTPVLLLWVALLAGVVAGVWHWRLRAIMARKRELERLVAARTAELEADKRALELARTALQVQATHDGLTGLRNRSSILEQLALEVARAQAAATPLAVALLDLDHFKQVNDTHGHLVGDAVLSGVADRLAHNMRGSDMVGRYGGEELLAVLPGLQPPADQRLRALHDAVGARPLAIDRLSLTVTCSVGVAWLEPEESPTELLRRADEALYRAKREGRNRIAVAPRRSATIA